MDARLTPGNDRAALLTLRGKIETERFVAGEPAAVALPLVDLCDRPDGARDRQLLLGDAVTVIDRHLGWAFVQANKDGYCGYLPETALGSATIPTHWVTAAATHLYPEPRVQARETASLSFGARVAVLDADARFARTAAGFVPAMHLAPLSFRFDDPAKVAALFLGTPYLWGGNSRGGIDCSGLVQAALLACGIACPGDSDLQQAVGTGVPATEALRRGDLMFWRGHVAIAQDDRHIIHATGHVMAVTVEETEAAIHRIAAAGLPVIARRRP